MEANSNFTKLVVTIGFITFFMNIDIDFYISEHLENIICECSENIRQMLVECSIRLTSNFQRTCSIKHSLNIQRTYSCYLGEAERKLSFIMKRNFKEVKLNVNLFPDALTNTLICEKN